MTDFTDKVALVTGGGSGIGQATAKLFAEKGAKVVVADMNVEGGEATVGMIKDAGGDATFIKTDVSKSEEVQAMVKTALDTYGKLDCAANNAGILGKFMPTHEYPEELFEQILAVNTRGVFLCMKHEIPAMLQSGGGAIVNTASAAGLVAQPMLVAYTASKHAVVGMTKVAAVEYAKAGIRINAVNPGGVATPMTADIELPEGFNAEDQPDPHPMGRYAQPEEIARTIVWLCSDEPSFMTGSTIAIDGGMIAV